MIPAIKKGTLQRHPLTTNGRNANDKDLHTSSLRRRRKEGACCPCFLWPGGGWGQRPGGDSFSQWLKFTSCIFRHRESSGNSNKVGGGAQMPGMCKSLGTVWTWPSGLDSAVLILGRSWDSPAPPVCWQFAGQKQDSGRFPAQSEKEQCAFLSEDLMCVAGQRLQQQMTRQGSIEHSWRPLTTQSQQREGLVKTFHLKVASEFTCLKNSAVRLASCLGWKNKRN